MTARTASAYDGWAATYDTESNPHIALEHDAVLSLVAARPDEDILDAACGTGKYTVHFHAAGARVRGVDFSAGMLSRARAKFPEQSFELVDLTRPLPFPDSSFDKINCAQALKHVRDLGAVFGEFARVLRPNGAFVFSVTHPDMIWDDYEVVGGGVSVDIRSETDMHQHRFCDYFAALEQAGIALDKLVQLRVGETIRQFLTPESYAKVAGRFQILIVRARRAS